MAFALDILWTFVILLVIIWLVGFLILPIAGGLIHILLVLAIIIILFRLLTGHHLATKE